MTVQISGRHQRNTCNEESVVVFADVVGVSSKKLKKFFSRTLLFLLLLL